MIESGTVEAQEIIEYQIEKLKEKGYTITSSYNMDTNCFVKVSCGDWTFGRAVIHDGSREDAQRAMHEAAVIVLNESWTHFRMNEK